jgi:hypothetical protein
VALDRALEALALRDPETLTVWPGSKASTRISSPTFSSPASPRNSARRRSGGAPALRRWPSSGLGQRLLAHAAEGELDGVVAVALGGADAGDRARAGLEHGHALDAAVVAEPLGHAELAGEDRGHHARRADLDVDAGGQVVEPLERVDRLRRRLVDVDQPLVGADLEVLLRVLVLERGADHA